ncbi:MAG: hypothetical protein V3U75_12935 [Methylococcaceae bacterium]
MAKLRTLKGRMGKLQGMDNVVNALNKEINKIEGRTLAGLIRGGIIIIRDEELTPPITPLDTGNLRASRFLITSKGDNPMGSSPQFKAKNKKGRIVANPTELAQQHNKIIAEYKAIAQKTGQPAVILGHSANYSMIVHEMVGAHFQRPGSGAKFLEESLKRTSKAVFKIIQEEARISK